MASHESNVTGSAVAEHGAELFAGLMELPSYLLYAESEKFKPEPDLGTRYIDAVEAVAKTLRTTPGVSPEVSAAAHDEFFGCNVLAGSDASEERLVFSGFKPAVFSGIGHDPAEHADVFGTIPVWRLCHGSLQQHIGAEYGFMYGEDLRIQSTSFHCGIIYNRSAVERAKNLHDAVYEQIGFDTQVRAETFARNVFTSYSRVAQSMLLGYSPVSAVMYFAAVPGEIPFSRHQARCQNDPRFARYRNDVSALCTPEQIEFLHKPQHASALFDVAKSEALWTMNQDYMLRRPTNTRAQVVLKETGISDYIDSYRKSWQLASEWLEHL